jgi:hypothetical protein
MKVANAAVLARMEASIERACTDLLELDGWRALKTDPVSRVEWGKGFGEKGMADYVYIRYGNFRSEPHYFQQHVLSEVLWIEWKAPKGRVAAHQRKWHAAERAWGALTLIAGVDFPASIEGFMAWYRASSLARSVRL